MFKFKLQIRNETGVADAARFRNSAAITWRTAANPATAAKSDSRRAAAGAKRRRRLCRGAPRSVTIEPTQSELEPNLDAPARCR
jgi:hypothetical protein